MDAPYPPCMSTYSLPSTSQTWEPWPWLIQTAWGWAICQLEVAPPARDLAASAIMAVLRGCRRTNASDSDVDEGVDLGGAGVDGHGGGHDRPFGSSIGND